MSFSLEWENPRDVSKEIEWDTLTVMIIKPKSFKGKSNYKTVKIKDDCR